MQYQRRLPFQYWIMLGAANSICRRHAAFRAQRVVPCPQILATGLNIGDNGRLPAQVKIVKLNTGANCGHRNSPAAKHDGHGSNYGSVSALWYSGGSAVPIKFT